MFKKLFVIFYAFYAIISNYINNTIIFIIIVMYNIGVVFI